MVPLGATPLTRPYTIENYDVAVQLDVAHQGLSGIATIRLRGTADISALELDAGALQIDSVMEGQASQSFERNRDKLFIVLTNPLRPDEPRNITISYRAGASEGLHFFTDQVYTSRTADWMPCNDQPGERSKLHLTITAPQNTKAAASGTFIRAVEGQNTTEWQLNSPSEPYWFGFAVGAFAENASELEGVSLRVLGAGPQVFEPTAAAIRYLTERSGKPFPGKTYTQVYAHGDVTRAMAGLTVLPEAYAQGLDKPAGNLGIRASELAHQWYGVEIAAKGWPDLWLSDGISLFLADGFLGQRFGKERFQREIENATQRYNQLRASGKDRPLSDPGSMTRQDPAGEALAYKAVSFLYLANQLIGESAFGEALRLFTAAHWGQEASTEDFQNAFDATKAGSRVSGKAAGKKKAPKTLDDLFDMWVYGIVTTNSK
jgi:aminopeptidase N